MRCGLRVGYPGRVSGDGLDFATDRGLKPRLGSRLKPAAAKCWAVTLRLKPGAKRSMLKHAKRVNEKPILASSGCKVPLPRSPASTIFNHIACFGGLAGTLFARSRSEEATLQTPSKRIRERCAQNVRLEQLGGVGGAHGAGREGVLALVRYQQVDVADALGAVRRIVLDASAVVAFVGADAVEQESARGRSETERFGCAGKGVGWWTALEQGAELLGGGWELAATSAALRKRWSLGLAAAPLLTIVPPGCGRLSEYAYQPAGGLATVKAGPGEACSLVPLRTDG